MDFTTEIKGHTLEYIDSEHIYLVDGLIVPSITQILKRKFGNKYSNVNRRVLKNAAQKGTEVHDAIEQYCKNGTESDLKEVINFKFLQRMYDFKVSDNEVPVILFDGHEPISAGRLDLVLYQEYDDHIEYGLGDIKRTSALDKEYLAYQLNLYRIAYRQCYDTEIWFLRGLHLRENVRRYIDIPINENMAWKLVQEYLGEEKNGNI